MARCLLKFYDSGIRFAEHQVKTALPAERPAWAKMVKDFSQKKAVLILDCDAFMVVLLQESTAVRDKIVKKHLEFKNRFPGCGGGDL